MTFSKEVSKMDMNKRNQPVQQMVGSEVDTWIAENELPASAALKVIRTSDPDYGLSQDEIQERNEFISWYLSQEFLVLKLIPATEHTHEHDSFTVPEFTVTDNGYSAFNTVDFQRNKPEFNKYAYAMKKIMERVKDLAIIHSAASAPKDKAETEKRYQSFVTLTCREQLLDTFEQYQEAQTPRRKQAMKDKIKELNRRILECKKIWERYAPDDYWDG
jgi:hypothetical protein